MLVLLLKFVKMKYLLRDHMIHDLTLLDVSSYCALFYECLLEVAECSIRLI